MAIPTPDNNRKVPDEKHRDDILGAHRNTQRTTFISFVIVMSFFVLVLFLLSLQFRDAPQAFLSSAADSLLITLFFTMLYALVVERAKGQADRKAQELMMDDLQQAIVKEVSTSTTNQVKTILDEQGARLVEHWPELVPDDYFPPLRGQDPNFQDKLGKAIADTTRYTFRGSTGRFVPKLLNDYAKRGTECRVTVLDPSLNDGSALEAYANDRRDNSGSVKTLKQHVTEVRDEIYTAIVLLFDLCGRFQIEVRTHNDYLFYRSEITDNRAFISFYVEDKESMPQPEQSPTKAHNPPTYCYTSAKGSFYLEAFRKDAQQSWGAAKHKRTFERTSTPADLEDFLIELGAGDKDSIGDKIKKWREEGQRKYMPGRDEAL